MATALALISFALGGVACAWLRVYRQWPLFWCVVVGVVFYVLTASAAQLVVFGSIETMDPNVRLHL